MSQGGFGLPRVLTSWFRYRPARGSWSALLRSLLVGSLMVGCAAASSSPTSPAGAEAQSASAQMSAQPAESVGAEELAPPPVERSADSTADEPAVATPNEAELEPDTRRAPRDVLYRVSSDGLVVEVEGVRLTPSAEVLERPNGGYGVRLRVVVEELEDDAHILLVPKHGPLSMAATVFDAKGKQVAEHADVREGGEYVLLGPGATREFTRDWPSGSVKGPLWWGRRLHLEVGLWGLGRSEEEQRPVRKLFQVDMTANAKPRAIITPPKVR